MFWQQPHIIIIALEILPLFLVRDHFKKSKDCMRVAKPSAVDMNKKSNKTYRNQKSVI